MTAPASNAERLAQIEVLLKQAVADIKSIKEDLEADKAELAALKNKGTGILIGIALAAAAVGAKIGSMIDAAVGAFK